jgi:hypothetical protein
VGVRGRGDRLDLPQFGDVQHPVPRRQRITARGERVSEQAGGGAAPDSHNKAPAPTVALDVVADMLVTGDPGPGGEFVGDAA